MFTEVRPTWQETQAQLPGDDLLGPDAWVVDSAMDLSAAPDEVKSWLEQVGRRDDISSDAPNGRGGWPLPHSVERFIPRKSRALREVDPSIKPLEAGDRIRDWFGKTAMMSVVEVDPSVLVLRGERPKKDIQWVWTLALEDQLDGTTRLRSRTRIEGLGRLGRFVGKIADRTVAAGLRAGLEERFASPKRRS